MRILEIAMIAAQIYNILITLEYGILIIVRAFTLDQKIANAEPDPKDKTYLGNKCSKNDFMKFKGGAFEFIFIEVAVWFCQLVSMVFLMLKSRCKRVGIDIGSQFEPHYNRLLVNRIAN
jgi:hypothetical protein